MTRRAYLGARAKQAALLSLLLGACADAKDSEPAMDIGQAGSSGAAGRDGAGGVAGAHTHPASAGGSSGTDAGVGGAGAVAASGGQAGGAAAAGAGGQAGGAAAAGAGGQAGAYTPPPCTIVAPTACPDPAPTYADVEPVFTQRCVVCHMGSADGPWPLNNYGHIASWSEDIRAMLLECAMPPPEERMPLPNADSLAILTWIRCGMPP